MLSPVWTYGPLLFGSSVALMLSGIVAVQCILFFKLYPDEAGIKTAMVRNPPDASHFSLLTLAAQVATVWALDLSQSFFIITSLFEYFVAHFGDMSHLDRIPWSVALTILVTAVQTHVVHIFYVQKIHKSSGKNWWITGPIASLAFLRLLAAIVSTAEMLRQGHWSAFRNPYPWFLFTTGLSLSAGVDLIITAWLCYFLRQIRRRSTSSVMQQVLDTLTLYTLENGLVTCLTTIGALTFWLVLPTSSLSLSLNFVIGKLYPNSLLVLLNTRKGLREMHSGDQGIHFDPSDHLRNYYTHFPHRAPRITPSPFCTYSPAFKMHKAEVSMHTTVERVSTEFPEPSFDKLRPPRSLRSHSPLHWPALP
ncbi:hypothetical protein B0H10DRAFT_2015231 [Mycena sp. CBHHK59/15]|nr:hypothetical protein B0H10DRAFT_2015231 [Mycena sp. CBHHK59/15]